MFKEKYGKDAVMPDKMEEVATGSFKGDTGEELREKESSREKLLLRRPHLKGLEHLEHHDQEITFLILKSQELFQFYGEAMN